MVHGAKVLSAQMVKSIVRIATTRFGANILGTNSEPFSEDTGITHMDSVGGDRAVHTGFLCAIVDDRSRN